MTDGAKPLFSQGNELNSLRLRVQCSTNIVDSRIRLFFYLNQKMTVTRTAWLCLCYNVLLCGLLVYCLGLPFFGIGILTVVSFTNAMAIVITLLAYKKVFFLHLVGPAVLLAQSGFCLQLVFSPLGEQVEQLVLASVLMTHAAAQFCLNTKWFLHAPLHFALCQVGLYLVNRVDTLEDSKEIVAAVMLNSVTPLATALASFQVTRTQVLLFMQKMRELVAQLEMKGVIRNVPQALFFMDEESEEVLYQSEALKAYFGSTFQ